LVGVKGGWVVGDGKVEVGGGRWEMGRRCVCVWGGGGDGEEASHLVWGLGLGLSTLSRR
jgi:hypothetical protein